MRKLSVIVVGYVVLLFSPSGLPAQQTLGFESGLSLAKISVTGSELGGDEHGYREGISLGVFLEVPVTDFISIQPEVFYVQKGTGLSGDGFESTYAWDFVEIPVLLRFNIPKEGGVVPYFLVGPALGLRTTCKVEGEGHGAGISTDCDESNVEIKSRDFGVVLGGGLSVRAGPGSIIFGGRYNYGLTNIDPGADGTSREVNHRAFSFRIGYGISLGG